MSRYGVLQAANLKPQRGTVCSFLNTRESIKHSESTGTDMGQRLRTHKFPSSIKSLSKAPLSRFRVDSVSLSTRTLNALMPEFEQRLVQQLTCTIRGRFGCTLLDPVRIGGVGHVDLRQVFCLSELREPRILQVQKKRTLGAHPSHPLFREPIPLHGL
jgi:hypothetical protein